MKNLALSFLVLLSATSVSAGEGRIRRMGSSAVPEQYIVVLQEKNPNAVHGLAKSIAASYGGKLRFVFDAIVGGFSIELSDEAATRLSADPRVAFVEENQMSTTIVENASRPVTNNSWHLDRIDERYWNAQGDLDGYYQYCSSGYYVNAYVLDEGINASHPEFYSGQVMAGADFQEPDSPKANNPCQSNSNGWHGTAVASILGGQTVGVASGVKLIPVRVATCTGSHTIDRVIAGLNWIVSENPSTVPGYASVPVNGQRAYRPALVNMSLWRNPGERSPSGIQLLASIEYAVDALIAQGITVVASANNFNSDACNYSPANLARGSGLGDFTGFDYDGNPVSVPRRVITVGATMKGDGRTTTTGSDWRWQLYNADGTERTGLDSGSNHGACVSIWAPGADIDVAHHQGGFTNRSGTSFAAPVVAGMVARYLQVHRYDSGQYSSAMPDQVWNWLNGTATHNQVQGTKNSRTQALPFIAPGDVVADPCRTRAVRR